MRRLLLIWLSTEGASSKLASVVTLQELFMSLALTSHHYRYAGKAFGRVGRRHSTIGLQPMANQLRPQKQVAVAVAVAVVWAGDTSALCHAARHTRGLWQDLRTCTHGSLNKATASLSTQIVCPPPSNEPSSDGRAAPGSVRPHVKSHCVQAHPHPTPPIPIPISDPPHNLRIHKRINMSAHRERPRRLSAT